MKVQYSYAFTQNGQVDKSGSDIEGTELSKDESWGASRRSTSSESERSGSSSESDSFEFERSSFECRDSVIDFET